MALLRKGIFAGALFAGALLASQQVPVTPVIPQASILNSGGDDEYTQEVNRQIAKKRVELQTERQAYLAQLRAEDDIILEIIMNAVTQELIT